MILKIQQFVKMQIKLAKALNKPIHLLPATDQQPTPKRSVSRTRLHPKGLERLIPKQNQPLISNFGPRSPSRPASKSTLKSKDSSLSIASRSRPKSKRTMNVSPSIRTCQNHQNEIGSFNIQIEGQKLYYCQKCALKLKNQGFPVKKQMEISSGSYRDQSQQISMSYAHLKGNPQFQTLKILLNQIYTAEAKIHKSQNTNIQIQELFDQKIISIRRFYEQVQQLIVQSQQKSINELIQLKEAWKSKDIHEKGKMNSLQVLRDMKVDIEANIQQIVGEVDQDTFKVCVDDYRQRLQFLTSKSQSKIYEADKIKISLANRIEQQLSVFSGSLQKMKRNSFQECEQNVITSQCDANYEFADKETTKASFNSQLNCAFNSQLNCEKDRSRKKIISRK